MLGKRQANVPIDQDNSPSKRGKLDGHCRVEGDSIVPQSDTQIAVPTPGTLVERNRVRRAGQYLIGQELEFGHGTQQTQYLARKENTDEYYLLKILTCDDETELTNRNTLYGKMLLHTEYSILSMLSDVEGVYRQHGMFKDNALEEKLTIDNDVVEVTYTGHIKSRLILVLDCVLPHDFSERSHDYMTLQKYVHSRTSLKELEALRIFYDIVKVIESLHNRNVIHRDLKLNHIVVNRHSKKVIVTNFSHARHLCSEDDDFYEQRGSPAYISPDVLTGSAYKGKPTDMWALGIILYSMLYGNFPFADTSPPILFRKIRQANFTFPSFHNTSRYTVDLVRLLLNPNPVERATASAVRAELNRIIARLSKAKQEVNQIVPDVDNLEDNANDHQPPRRKVVDIELKPPSHELWRGSFSRALETGIPQRETHDVNEPTMTKVRNMGINIASRQIPSNDITSNAVVHVVQPQQRPSLAGSTRNVVQSRPTAVIQNSVPQAMQHQGSHVVVPINGVSSTLHYRAQQAQMHVMRQPLNADPTQRPRHIAAQQVQNTVVRQTEYRMQAFQVSVQPIQQPIALQQQLQQQINTALVQHHASQSHHPNVMQHQAVRPQSLQQHRDITPQQLPIAIASALIASSQPLQQLPNATSHQLIPLQAQHAVPQPQQSNVVALLRIPTSHQLQQQRNFPAQRMSNVPGQRNIIPQRLVAAFAQPSVPSRQQESYAVMLPQDVGAHQSQQQPPNLTRPILNAPQQHVCAAVSNLNGVNQHANAVAVAQNDTSQPLQQQTSTAATLAQRPTLVSRPQETTNRFADPAIQNLYNAMNEKIHSGRIPLPTRTLMDTFDGIIAFELGDRIANWFLAHFYDQEIIRELFLSGAGSIINKLTELLRRVGVRMDCNDSLMIIKPEQYPNVVLFMTLLMQSVEMNNTYFVHFC